MTVVFTTSFQVAPAASRTLLEILMRRSVLSDDVGFTIWPDAGSSANLARCVEKAVAITACGYGPIASVLLVAHAWQQNKSPVARCPTCWRLPARDAMLPQDGAGAASLNRRCAFDATVSPISSAVTPRAVPSRATVKLTHAGSFLFPRCGTGAK